jgi:hypothetical protein
MKPERMSDRNRKFFFRTRTDLEKFFFDPVQISKNFFSDPYERGPDRCGRFRLTLVTLNLGGYMFDTGDTFGTILDAVLTGTVIGTVLSAMACLFLAL